MEKDKLLDILKLRAAVYLEGCRCAFWPRLEDNGAKEYMHYLFPKSGELAHYNLVLEVVRSKHKQYIPIGQYSLFNFPGQIEEQLLSYLKAHPETDFLTLPGDAQAYIEQMATVACDVHMLPVLIGSLAETKLDSLLRVIAVHYKNAFSNTTSCYPYFN